MRYYTEFFGKRVSIHVMKILKGKRAERRRDELPELRKKYWGDAL